MTRHPGSDKTEGPGSILLQLFLFLHKEVLQFAIKSYQFLRNNYVSQLAVGII